MEFDKSRVYTALNADELKVGSKVICADNLCSLKFSVDNELYITTLREILPEDCRLRFGTKEGEEYTLAYLISEPEEKKLKWTDLKVGDIISNQVESLMVVGINTKDIPGMDGRTCHVNLGGFWISDDGLEDWEKVEK